MYKLSIRKLVENPSYDIEKAVRHPRYYNEPYPEQPYIEQKALEVDLTDEEFAAIKKAVLEVM